MSPSPMDEFWIRLLTALVLLHQTTSTTNTEELFGTVGGSVTLHIQETSGGDAAAWNFEDIHIVTASFEDPPQVLFTKQALKTRFAVSEKGRALSISQLRLEDAGTYSVTIEGKKRSTFILHVYKKLAEPTVTCEAQNCSSDGSCSFSLRCSVSGTDFGNVSYTWRAGDQSWGDGPVVVLVNKSSLEQPEPRTCTAQNPVSSRSITVKTPDLLCTESSMHRHGLGSHSRGRAVIWLIPAIGVAVLFLALLLFLHKSKGCRKFRLSKPKPTDPDATTVYAEVGPSQQRIPNGIKTKPMDGESTTTVYSLVKRPDQVENGAATSLELI